MEIEIDPFNDATLNQLNSALTLRSTSIKSFMAFVENRYGSFREVIFHLSMWLDPQL